MSTAWRSKIVSKSAFTPAVKPSSMNETILFVTFFLVVGSVAIHLVSVKANPVLSRKTDQLRMQSRLSLDCTATGYTLPSHLLIC